MFFTIFFSQCNLRCVFCQNFGISWEGHGRPVTAQQLADEISPETFINIMPQYRPAGLAARDPAIARPLRQTQFEVLHDTRSAGEYNGMVVRLTGQKPRRKGAPANV